MGVAADMLASWRAPRAVFRRRLSAGQREDRAAAVLLLACALLFVSSWPILARAAHLDPDGPPLDMRLGGALLGWVCLAPLVFYAVAGVSHLVALPFGGRGSFYAARLALFWSLLAAAPLWLLHGLAAGLAGPGPILTVVASVATLAFFAIWGACLWEAERGRGRVAA
ncbi:YIP1 family protein [Tropicimonas sp. IMCC34011]|uniref:YIP1 family protein n=1 Tax=Tropicimonas sp. IMCC34011 TaxID=2248759 RepID=UPI000E26ECE3|nr:YIP1 family protein [Tropicimonas sp. IMCC34011]